MTPPSHASPRLDRGVPGTLGPQDDPAFATAVGPADGPAGPTAVGPPDGPAGPTAVGHRAPKDGPAPLESVPAPNPSSEPQAEPEAGREDEPAPEPGRRHDPDRHPVSRPEPGPQSGVTRQDIFSVLGALGAILTLVTAVMFYFGWRRSAVQASAMSIDVSLFGFTSQDYVLRSISALYLPLIVGLGLCLGWLWLHSWVTRGVREGRRLTDPRQRASAARLTFWIAVVSGAVATGCVLFALAAGASSPPSVIVALAQRLRDEQWAIPVLLVGSTLASSYAWWLHKQVRPPRPDQRVPLWRRLLPIALVAGTVSLGVFWLLEEYASAVGRGYARQIAANVGELARTVVISPVPLGIEAPGVVEERIGDVGSPEVQYHTTGLRLLARSGGKVILLHEGWTPASGTVVVLADTEALTWQFSR